MIARELLSAIDRRRATDTLKSRLSINELAPGSRRQIGLCSLNGKKDRNQHELPFRVDDITRRGNYLKKKKKKIDVMLNKCKYISVKFNDKRLSILPMYRKQRIYYEYAHTFT